MHNRTAGLHTTHGFHAERRGPVTAFLAEAMAEVPTMHLFPRHPNCPSADLRKKCKYLNVRTKKFVFDGKMGAKIDYFRKSITRKLRH
jgi:hypothetical protein